MLETYSHLVTVVGSCVSKPYLITLLEQEKEPWMAVKEETDRLSPDLESEYETQELFPDNHIYTINLFKQTIRHISETFELKGSSFSNGHSYSTFRGLQDCQEGDVDQKNTNKEKVPTYTCHTLTHSLEKLYECKEYGKYFGCSSTLTQYQSIHSVEKPYECKDCGKAFKIQQHLT
ncbi:rCG54270, partial [Rattus norvegicus]